MFNLTSFLRLVKCVFSINVRTTFANNFFFLALCSCTSGVLICGDVELSPGPRKTKSCYNFSSCNCNLNSITTYNFSKTPVLEMYNSQHKFDIFIFFFFFFFFYQDKKKNIYVFRRHLDSSFQMIIPDLTYRDVWLEQIFFVLA